MTTEQACEVSDNILDIYPGSKQYKFLQDYWLSCYKS